MTMRYVILLSQIMSAVHTSSTARPAGEAYAAMKMLTKLKQCIPYASLLTKCGRVCLHDVAHHNMSVSESFATIGDCSAAS